MKKTDLRKIYLVKQQTVSDSERREKSRKISERFFADFGLSYIRFLHVFISIQEKGELDTTTIINKLWNDVPGIKPIVPRVNSAIDQLEHLEFKSGGEIAVSDWGIPEPVGTSLIVEQEIDLVLVPMLCFDERGYRVGHGKGYYDKFLVKCRDDCLKIGLSMFDPVEQIEDVQEFDVRLNYCVTPKKVWKFS